MAGERIGEWLICNKLGSGGMSSVHRCENAVAPRLRGAIKLVPLGDDDPDEGAEQTRGRFLREVDTLAALRHPSLVRVLSCGEVPERSLIYLVMELVEGRDLASVLERGALDWRIALRVFRDLAEGLGHAHGRGVAHRDVKPANIMVCRDGVVVLVDFGIAFDQERTRLTEVGFVPGTVEYLAPECFRGGDGHTRDRKRGDVYALGVVIYEALTGEKAFRLPKELGFAEKLGRLVHEKQEKGPLDPGEGLPEALRDLVRSCTDPDPERRPAASDIARTLSQLALEELATPPPSEYARETRQPETEGGEGSGLEDADTRSEDTFAVEMDQSLWELLGIEDDEEAPPGPEPADGAAVAPTQPPGQAEEGAPDQVADSASAPAEPASAEPASVEEPAPAPSTGGRADSEPPEPPPDATPEPAPWGGQAAVGPYPMLIDSESTAVHDRLQAFRHEDLVEELRVFEKRRIFERKLRQYGIPVGVAVVVALVAVLVGAAALGMFSGT